MGFHSLIVDLFSFKSNDQTEMFIILCNPVMFLQLQNRNLDVLENENSLTVKISKESDIKQSTKTYI